VILVLFVGWIILWIPWMIIRGILFSSTEGQLTRGCGYERVPGKVYSHSRKRRKVDGKWVYVE
jgi:hypothetical protein